MNLDIKQESYTNFDSRYSKYACHKHMSKLKLHENKKE